MILPVVNRYFILILIPFSAFGKENFVYKCCYMQNTFQGAGCKVIEQSSDLSEFSLTTHQAIWSPPSLLRYTQDGEENGPFQLVLETRPEASLKLCEKSRVHYETPKRENAILVGDNITSGDGPPQMKFDQNGTMLYENYFHSHDSYCFDSLHQQGPQTTFDVILLSKCPKQASRIVLSSSSTHYLYDKRIKIVFAAVAGLSSLFTLSILIIYLKLRNFLNTSGWTEFGYFIALGLFNILAIPALLTDKEEDTTICYILSASLHFFEITMYSSFFMICVDLYWMLRKSDSIASYGEDNEEISKGRLLLYYITILILPIGLTSYRLVHHEDSYNEYDVVCHESCLSPSWQLAEYILFSLESLSFLLVLVSLNHILGRLSRTADVDDAPRVSLLSNIFYFSLSYWIMDLLKFTRPMFSGHGQVKYENQIFWKILDCLTYAQGIWVFLVFAFNRKTLKAFKMKSGRDATLKEIFRHACCSTGDRQGMSPEDEMPMSPLMQNMKSTSLRRATVRHNQMY